MLKIQVAIGIKFGNGRPTKRRNERKLGGNYLEDPQAVFEGKDSQPGKA